METTPQTPNKHRLVFGLGSGLIYSLGPNWKELVPKLLNSFDNDVLVSTIDMAFTILNTIKGCINPHERLYIDSGGFTLYKYEKKYGKDSEIFKQECEKVHNRFIKILKTIGCKETFELDNEYFRVDDDLMSPKNYCREEVKAITGFYPTPVFKMHQGFEYWKRLCESDLYPRLAIGGMAQTREWHTRVEDLKHMMEYARMHNKKVHLLGCQNVDAFKAVQPNTVDYSVFQYAINLKYARDEHPELKEYRELSPHAVCYAIARAKARGFLYDCYNKDYNEE